MSHDREMPESWRRNSRARPHEEITAAIERARRARAEQLAPARIDELAQRRVARLAAEDARRRFQPTDPPGPRTA